MRFLANLTSATSVTNANFIINLQTHLLDGCLHSYDNDYLVLPAGSVRVRPAAGYGSTLYPVSLSTTGLDVNGNPRCGPRDTYYSVNLPQGLAGTMEADNHTVQGHVTIDGINWDKGDDYTLPGNRSITGRIYAPNQNINNNFGDFSGGGFLTLRDAASNDNVQAPGDMQSSYELSIPELEAKAYTLSINQDQIPYGYVAQPFPMDPIVPVDLTKGDVDIPAASGFVLTLHRST